MSPNEIFSRYIKFIHCTAYETSERVGKIIDEPSFISAFIENHKTLEEYLNANPSSTYYIVDAVYTHQTPKVIPDGFDKSVEIADLLIVNILHPGPQLPITGNAMLFQAKRHEKPETGSLAAENENIQFNLYKDWPEFIFKNRMDYFNGANFKWNLNLNKTPGEEQSKYLVIYKGEIFENNNQYSPEFLYAKFKEDSPWNSSVCEGTTKTSAEGLPCEENFAVTLEGIITGGAGRPFNTGNNVAYDHWSDFVQKMLTLAVNPSYTYNLSRQGIKNNQRHVSISSFIKNISTLTFTHEVMNLKANNNYSYRNNDQFLLTNALLGRDDFHSNDNPPPSSEDDFFYMPPSHPPMLIINSFSKDEFFRNNIHRF